MTARRALPPASLLLLGAFLLAGCSGATEQAAPQETSAATAAPAETAAPVETTAPEPAPTEATPEKLTCALMIPESVSSALSGQGWTSTESKIYAGTEPVADSLVCTWAPANALSGQMYGVGRLNDTQENQMRSDLKLQGWTAEESAEGVYYAAPVAPAPAPSGTASTAPNEGSNPAPAADGFTYLFGDGWVKYSDTREGLLLIVTPVD